MNNSKNTKSVTEKGNKNSVNKLPCLSTEEQKRRYKALLQLRKEQKGYGRRFIKATDSSLKAQIAIAKIYGIDRLRKTNEGRQFLKAIGINREAIAHADEKTLLKEIDAL